MRKAREGKIGAPRKVTYSFKLNASRDGYEIDEEKMGSSDASSATWPGAGLASRKAVA